MKNSPPLPALALLAAAAAVSASLAFAAPGVTPLQESKPIEVDGLAALANAPAIEDATLTTALVKGKPAATSFARPVSLPGGQRAVAWTECSKANCLGFWALLDGDNESLKVLARGPLPVKEKTFFQDGYIYTGSAVVSMEGGGPAWVMFHYTVTEPPRKDLDSITHEYVDILDPAAKKVIFHQELKRTGAQSEKSCSYSLIARSQKNLPAIEVKS